MILEILGLLMALAGLETDMENMERNRKTNFKAVMGWDIGDKNSVAFIRLGISNKEKLLPLYIHKNHDMQVVKSAVSKSSSGIITIGEDATRQQEFVTDFKRSPKNWNNKSFMRVSYRQHMSDYIKRVSETILQNSSNRGNIKTVIVQDNNGEMHWKKDEVLLVVSCPASVAWSEKEMRKQYEKLISEATGISNVIVVEESYAAVFSLLDIGNFSKKINLQTGVLVLNFGHSIVDAAYIRQGKKTINIRWELGAAQIENAMLEYILQSDKTKKQLRQLAKIYDKEQVLVMKNSCNHAFFQLRINKEDYFDGKLGENAAQSVSIPIMDMDGDMLFDEDGETVELHVMYSVTDEMMQYALNEYEFNARKDGVVVSHGTWTENCWQFLEDVKQTLEREKLSVQTVVVTGGGSQMPFTVELSNKAFPGKVIYSDSSPFSVAKGLVTIACIAYNKAEGSALHDMMISWKDD